MKQIDGVKVMRCMKKESGPAICRTGGVLKGCLIGGMLFISACASYEKSNFSVGSIPGDYRTNHPIVVSQSEVVRDLIVPSNAKGMTFRQENILNELAIQYRQFGANTMRILMPSGSHNENAARRVVKDIVEHLATKDITAKEIQISRYHASNHGDSASVRVSFDALDAKVNNECGKWEDDLRHSPENTNDGNFGCATQNNLAEMIANPADLVNPRAQSPIDAPRRDNVINVFRAVGG